MKNGSRKKTKKQNRLLMSEKELSDFNTWAENNPPKKTDLKDLRKRIKK